MTARGAARLRQWFVPFSKGPDGETILDETVEMAVQAPLFLAPVLAVWAELWRDEYRKTGERPVDPQ